MAELEKGEAVIPIATVRMIVNRAYGDDDFIFFCLDQYEKDPTYFDDVDE